jgi:hypothetical protein
VALVQTKTGGSNPVPTITWTSNTTSGNLIIVLVGINSGAITVTGITDSQSNSYARIDSGGAGDGTNIYEFWYAYNITGGTTPTITTTTSAGAATQLIIREYSGIIGSSNPLIGHNTDRDSVLSSAASAGWASGPPNCLIVGGCGTNSTSGSFTAGTGFGNIITQNGAAGGDAIGLEDATGGSFAASYQGTMTIDTNRRWRAFVATFKSTSNYKSTPSNELTYVRVGDGMSRSEVAN